MKLNYFDFDFAGHQRQGVRFILMFVLLLAAIEPNASASPFVPAHRDKTFTEYFRHARGWAAGDVATSIPLSDGRVLWLFGDSYVDQLDAATETVPCLFDVRDAVLVQNTNDPSHLKILRGPRSGDRSFFHPPDAIGKNFWPCFWPGTGFQDGNTIYIYLTEIDQTGQGGMWGFKDVGQSWAKMSYPELKITGYVKLPSFNGIAFWCGFIKDDESGFTYAYGVKRNFTAGDVYVARFQTKNPETNWEFWDGKNWNREVGRAAVIAQGASFSVNVCKVNGKFLLTTSEFSVACDQGRKIYISTSDKPTGPFSPRREIFSVDNTVNGHHPFFYGVAAHPEFINADGLLITYCINGYAPCVPTCVHGRMNPDYYRPQAIRLPLNW